MLGAQQTTTSLIQNKKPSYLKRAASAGGSLEVTLQETVPVTYQMPRQIENNKLMQSSEGLMEMKLLKMCQKMVDKSVKMECAHCQGIFLTTDFYDHV